MLGLGVPELLIIALVLAGPVTVVVLLVLLVRALRQPVAVAREWRWVQLTRVVGLLVGAWAAWQVAWRFSYGVGPMLAPAAFGLCVVLAAALGETVVRPPRREGVRTASLTPRRVREYLPPVLGPVVGAVLVVMVLLLTFTTLTASRDEYTGGMRALTCTTATSGSSHTPYPGSYYSLPLAGVLAVVLLVAALTARRVVRRPRGMAEDVQGDDELRRRSLGVVVSAVGIAVCAPYVGVGATAAMALLSVGSGSPSCTLWWAHPVGIVVGVTVVVALVVGLVCVGRLLVGAPQASRQREVVAR